MRGARVQAVRRPGVALLGCGAWGANHLRVWSELGHLVVACDPDPARRRWVRSQYPDLAVSGSPDEAIRRGDVEIVVVATPAATHGQVALAAIEAGKDVLVEKPLATRLSEAEAISTAATRTGAVVAVGHVLEYHPAITKLKSLVAEGALGRVLYAYSNRLNFGRLRTEENALWSFAPHDVALMCRLLGGLPETASCVGGSYVSPGVADVTLLSLEFRPDVRAHVFVSWLHPFKEHRFVVVGEEQMAVFDDTNSWDTKLVLYPHRVEWLNGRVPVANVAQNVAVPLEPSEPLRDECERFVECVRDRTRPLTDVESGLRVLEVLAAGERSLETSGQPIELRKPTACDRVAVESSAVVETGAEVGDDSKIWRWCHVMRGARIGRGCVLGQGVFVGGAAKIGDRVKVQNNVSVYDGVQLEDEVFCGPSVVFTNVKSARTTVDRSGEFVRTRVCSGASLGANSTVVCGVTVGAHALVGAGAVVTNDVVPHALVVGVPARQIGWVCECGETLREAACEWHCLRCGNTYYEVASENGVQFLQASEGSHELAQKA
jgi:UDP-2-acetamido-3-amino-2,3-dideoxy-glucuronate N-acetyltransferase